MSALPGRTKGGHPTHLPSSSSTASQNTRSTSLCCSARLRQVDLRARRQPTLLVRQVDLRSRRQPTRLVGLRRSRPLAHSRGGCAALSWGGCAACQLGGGYGSVCLVLARPAHSPGASLKFHAALGVPLAKSAAASPEEEGRSARVNLLSNTARVGGTSASCSVLIGSRGYRPWHRAEGGC